MPSAAGLTGLQANSSTLPGCDRRSADPRLGYLGNRRGGGHDRGRLLSACSDEGRRRMNFGVLDVVLAITCTVAIGAAAGFLYSSLLPPPASERKERDSGSNDSKF